MSKDLRHKADMEKQSLRDTLVMHMHAGSATPDLQRACVILEGTQGLFIGDKPAGRH